MNELTAEWIDKAEGDYATASRELPVQRRPNYDAVCFHAQQTAEKYLKAFLQDHGMNFPKTHSLIELLELCLLKDNSLENWRNDLIRLSRYAVLYRYPGEAASRSEAEMAFTAIKSFRAFMRQKLNVTTEE
jgi:HEPN domain-containing protein